jgi:hypothetical protein
MLRCHPANIPDNPPVMGHRRVKSQDRDVWSGSENDRQDPASLVLSSQMRPPCASTM